MLGFPLGILSAAGADLEAGPAYELISTTILASATSSITFSSLATYASDYKHLQLRFTARTTRTEINDGLAIQLNGDTASNYDLHVLSGNGSSVSSSASINRTNTVALDIAGNTATSNAFGGGVVEILDPYSTTKNTTFRGLGGVASNFNSINLRSGLHRSTAAISSMTLISTVGSNFGIGSRFSLYGIKG